jgi:predicted metalloendopeptidase
MTAVERRDVDKTYNKMTRRRSRARARVRVARLLQRPSARRTWKRSTWPSPSSSPALAKLAAERPVREWQAYLRYHLLKDSAPYLSSPYEREHSRSSAAS